MIRHTVAAAFLLRDGFSGQVFADASGTRCLLDGKPLRRPIWKREGYLVLTDLEPGEHQLTISRTGFREETVTVRAAEGEPVEDTISLKPGKGYRFPPGTVRVSLTLRERQGAAAGRQIWLGIVPRPRLKLAQEKTEAGDEEAHLFCEGNPALLPIPGHFLLAGGKEPELVYLRSLREETGRFYPPLALSHPRGTEFVPMQAYTADEAGTVQVLLREPGTLKGYADGKVFEALLQAGEQVLEWKLEG